MVIYVFSIPFCSGHFQVELFHGGIKEAKIAAELVEEEAVLDNLYFEICFQSDMPFILLQYEKETVRNQTSCGECSGMDQ